MANKFPMRRLFEAWLKSLDPETIVALPAWGACDCPLAKWLKDKDRNKYPWPYIRPSSNGERNSRWWSDYRVKSFPDTPPKLPKWANEFALAIDSYVALAAPIPAVTAKFCLGILNAI